MIKLNEPFELHCFRCRKWIEYTISAYCEERLWESTQFKVTVYCSKCGAVSSFEVILPWLAADHFRHQLDEKLKKESPPTISLDELKELARKEGGKLSEISGPFSVVFARGFNRALSDFMYSVENYIKEENDVNTN